MKQKTQIPLVFVALPFAYQDGMDKYYGIMRFLREKGIDWELRVLREMFDKDEFRRCISEPVSGVICGVTSGRFGIERDDTDLSMECLEVCRRRNIPLVGLDWSLEKLRSRNLRRCSFLNIDSEKVGTFAAEVYLSSGNYSSYGFAGMFPKLDWVRSRGTFFVRRLRKAGLRNISIYKGDLLKDEPGLCRWLKGLRKPAAIFASNDCAADVILKTCMRNSLRIPEDLSVLGVDDDPLFCVHARPTLSSIHPDFEEMGYRAAEELERFMSGASNGRRIVVSGKQTVTKRMSTAPCSPAGVMVRRVDEIISDNACRNIDSDAIAAELKISRRLLDLRYRQLTGMSVREAIVRVRIERAKHLLSYSGHSIGTVCRLCGYRTESYFGKVFRAKEGISMGEYRMRH